MKRGADYVTAMRTFAVCSCCFVMVIAAMIFFEIICTHKMMMHITIVHSCWKQRIQNLEEETVILNSHTNMQPYHLQMLFTEDHVKLLREGVLEVRGSLDAKSLMALALAYEVMAAVSSRKQVDDGNCFVRGRKTRCPPAVKKPNAQGGVVEEQMMRCFRLVLVCSVASNHC